MKILLVKRHVPGQIPGKLLYSLDKTKRISQREMTREKEDNNSVSGNEDMRK